jgi:transposase
MEPNQAGTVNLSRDQAGCLHARFLGAVVGRSGTVYQAWLKAQPDEDGVETATLDPFRRYANATATAFPTRSPCWTPSTWSGSAPRSSTKVRRRSNKTRASGHVFRLRALGRRGHKDDPLYKIRGLLCHGEHLTERQQAKITACLNDGDPTGEVNVAWQY